MNLPWFMYSPSPVTLFQYGILIWIFWGYFLKVATYKKHPRILAAVDAALLVAFFVVLTDSFWCMLCVLKWLPLFPGDAIQIYSSLGRDLLAAALFGIMICDHLKKGVLQFSKTVIFWLLLSLSFQIIWFSFSPSPAYTDFTFAWRHGYPPAFVLAAFILSHFIMRIPLWLALLNTRSDLWK